jgi:UDP-N-acetylmuramyl pentapeptide phosphotransferase/UDP-N-acetylglucosamine-1-phosphate transferase
MFLFSFLTLTLFISSFLCLQLSLPFLKKIALAKQNERSSHIGIIPQGAGIVIFLLLMFFSLALRNFQAVPFLAYVIIATILSLIGFWDDVKNLPVLPRFLAQGLAVAFSLYWLEAQNGLPFFLLFLSLLWYVNLSNFMDGIDLMTVSHVIFMAIGLASFAYFGQAPFWLFWISCFLIAALLGFAPFNIPKAKLFIGDAGSLPLGLLIGIMLIAASERTGLMPPFILTLYYLADSGLTLILRLMRGEKVWLPHRTHFYQKASDNGLLVPQILVRICLIQVCLIGLSLYAAMNEKAQTLCLGFALLLVAGLLFELARKRTLNQA